MTGLVRLSASGTERRFARVLRAITSLPSLPPSLPLFLSTPASLFIPFSCSAAVFAVDKAVEMINFGPIWLPVLLGGHER